MVQDLALFPHMTVAENMAFGIDGWSREQQRRRVTELVELLGLQGLESRLPRSISGGQQQRTALGRALAANPRVLLLDEPFTALDTPVRNTLRREVSRLRRQLGLAALFVTHDLQEAYALADRIAIYDDGAVLQSGTREEVFRAPDERAGRAVAGRAQYLRRARRGADRGVHGSRDAVVPRPSARRAIAEAGRRLQPCRFAPST